MIVVDSNVVSELMRPRPAPLVRQWILDHADRDLVTTAITVAEIGYGIEGLPDGKRKRQLKDAADTVFTTFGAQVLPFGVESARHYAAIVAGRDRAGRPIDGFDAQIAAICRANGSSLATRNTEDFVDVGVDLIDPWRAG
jgi:toxin FitB